MAHEKHSEPPSLRTKLYPLNKRRRRELLRERRPEWERRDQQIMTEAFPRPSICIWASTSHVTRAKSHAKHNHLTKVRELFMDLAAHEDWDRYERLSLYLTQMAAEIRAVLPGETDLRGGLVRMHAEMAEAMNVTLDGASDGELCEDDKRRILDKGDEAVASYRRLRRRIAHTVEKTEALG